MARPIAALPLVAALLLPARATAQPLPVAAPASAGFSAAGLARLDSAMAAYVADGRLPGIVVTVARGGRLVHWKAFGLRSVEAGAPLRPDDLFRIYSMTKPITSVAVMMLVEDGRVALEDPVAKYIPAFVATKVWTPLGPVPQRRAMTVRDLLRHTAGLTYGYFGETPADSAYRRADPSGRAADLADLMERLAALPLVDQPGDRWNYSFATDVLGRIVEVASGRSLDRFFRERVFAPLRMDDTFFEVPSDRRGRFTGYYARVNGRFVLSDSPDTGSYTRPPKVLSGGGGLVSSAADYARFMQMLLNGGELDGARLLRRETVAEMLRNQLPGELVPISVAGLSLAGTGFGLGFSVVVHPQPPHDDRGRASWAGYANTFFFVDPARQLSAAVYTQFFPFAAYPLEEDFRRLVYAALR
jgi:CubicO group peptidase (beta-lactamase class C family)